MMFGDYEVARAEQHAHRAACRRGTLDIRPESNGGVQIQRGTGSTYGITACIGAGARTRAEAQAAADGVRLVDRGQPRPRHRRRAARQRSVQSWSVQLIVTAPDGASIDVETTNGPIGVDGLLGHARGARVQRADLARRRHRHRQGARLQRPDQRRRAAAASSTSRRRTARSTVRLSGQPLGRPPRRARGQRSADA